MTPTTGIRPQARPPGSAPRTVRSRPRPYRCPTRQTARRWARRKLMTAGPRALTRHQERYTIGTQRRAKRRGRSHPRWQQLRRRPPRRYRRQCRLAAARILTTRLASITLRGKADDGPRRARARRSGWVTPARCRACKPTSGQGKCVRMGHRVRASMARMASTGSNSSRAVDRDTARPRKRRRAIRLRASRGPPAVKRSAEPQARPAAGGGGRPPLLTSWMYVPSTG